MSPIETELSSSDQLLPAGKLPASLLANLLSVLPITHPQVLLGPAVGEDAAVIAWEEKAEKLLVVKSDPITFATDEIGYYAVNVCANDIAVTGATPRFYLPTLLLPAEESTPAIATAIFHQIAESCRALNIVVVGGHSEITASVRQPIIAGTMIGEVKRSLMVTSSGARPGDLILMTGVVPTEGISIIAREMREELLTRGWSATELEEAARYLYEPGISVKHQALVAAQTGIVSAMHDPTEGGIATGLHELATAAGVGMDIELEQITIPDIARRLCAEFGLNPLGTIASGSLLATVPADYVGTVLSVWEAHGWPAHVIGTVVDKQNGIVVRDGGKRRPLPLFPADEITKLWPS